MNRRIFTKQASGILAALGAVVGIKTASGSSKVGDKEFAGMFPFPDGADSMYLGFEVRRSAHYTFDGPKYTYLITHQYIDREGKKSTQVEVAVGPLDLRPLENRIGTWFGSFPK